MKVYVICPKDSSNEDVLKEFVAGYSREDIDSHNVRTYKHTASEINRYFDAMLDDEKSFLEVREITLAINSINQLN